MFKINFLKKYKNKSKPKKSNPKENKNIITINQEISTEINKNYLLDSDSE